MNDSLAKAYRTRGAARDYGDRHRGTALRRFVSRREHTIVTRFLQDLPSHELLLDIPCGVGRHTARFRDAKRLTFAMDASLDMIREGIGRANLQRGATAAASIFRLPLSDRSVAGCACLRFFHHLENSEQRRAVLIELKRVVRGPLVLSLWTPFNLQWARRALRQRRGRRPSSRYALRLDRLGAELAATGWRLCRKKHLFPGISETVYLLLRHKPGK